MLFYRASLPLSRQTLNFAAGIIRRHRISIGSLWRKLNPGQQALLVLVYLRKGETFASLAAGFGVGTATAWRYVEETVALLAARAPRLRKAVRDAARAGHAYVVLDGTLIPIDRSPRTGPPTPGSTRPTRRTRSSAHPVKGRTPSSRPGRSSPNSAAAPGAPVSSPRPSTYCSSAKHNQDGKGSMRQRPTSGPRRAGLASPGT
jgi:hypothetical protein